MKHRRAAASYAKALFAVAKEKNQTEVVSRELGAIAAMFEGDEKLRDVFAAVPLTDAQRGVLSAKLTQTLGGRHAALEEVLDRALLGGFIAESGSIVLDGSLEGQLERMRRRLTTGSGTRETGQSNVPHRIR